MNDMAIKKIQTELAAFNGGNVENVMKKEVATALCDFCRQDKAFADAVAHGGSFADCMASVAKNFGFGISDIEAYKRAVQFFFPGAVIEMKMTIDISGEAEKQKLKGSALVLNLMDFI